MSTDLIMGLGDDAQSNNYDLKFPVGIPGGGSADNIALRADQSFDPPGRSISTYDIVYRGLKVTKVGNAEETEKVFSIDVRVDGKWEVYDDLERWIKLVFDPETHIGMDQAQVSTTMQVVSYGRNDEVAKTITFKGVILKGLKVGSFDQNGTDPIRLTLDFAFANFF